MEKDNHGILYRFLKKALFIISGISPVLATRLIYFYHCKKILHLKNPKSFNEKINYIKLYINKQNELITQCADKIEVRKYVASKQLEDILINVIGIYDNIDEIDWKTLPSKFVIKCNHGSGFNIICHDKEKYNENEIKSQLKKWLLIDYGRYTSEIHYCKIKPRIIIEEDIAGIEGNLLDYKIFCFEGKAKYIEVVTGREKEEVFYEYYDLNWNKCNFTKNKYLSKNILSKPNNLGEMIKIAEKLSSEFKFVRVDLYNVNNKIYFGELTFTPSGGCCTKFTDEGEIILGDCIKL